MTFLLTGCCYRMSRLLGLDHAQDGHQVYDASQACDEESRRRLVWSCFILDSIVSSGVDANSSWKDSYPKIPLPVPDTDFVSQNASRVRNSLTLEMYSGREKELSLDVRSQTIYLVYLRTRVLG